MTMTAINFAADLPDSVTLSVDYYGRPLEAMIAAGKYDWENNRITANRFPLVGSGVEQFNAKLFYFGRMTRSQNNVDAIKATGWELGKIEHLLAFGERYPEEQYKYPIVALGSFAKVFGFRHVPCLDRDYEATFMRVLDLSWWGSDWRSDCCFLAVRKLS